MKVKTNIKLDIAVADNRNSYKWRNTRVMWPDLVTDLTTTVYTDETVKQYFAMPKPKQDEIKDRGGFVGGYLRGGRRLKNSVEFRQVVCLDVDHGDLDVWADFRLMEYCGLFYTTHKHRRDDPRFRIVFPLDRKVSADEYECIARVMAEKLGIDAFDDSTYQPSRLMYWPTTPKDGEFLSDYAEGDIVSADELLGELPDWTDPTTWPLSSREKEIRQSRGNVKMEDPASKTGIVGAFCRAYNIHEAIAEFLDEVYEPYEDTGRYTFTGGSTGGGLVVYNDVIAYSHHSTDPISGKACNAFDLVRLHKFGDLDDGKNIEDITKAPSYKAMADFAGGLDDVKREIVGSRKDKYEEAEERGRRVGSADDWVSELETEGKKGKIKDTISNAVIILKNDENLKDKLAFNEFEHREVAMFPLPWDKIKKKKYPRPLSDRDDAQLRLYLERCYDVTHRGNIQDAALVTVSDNSFHPVRDYLDALEWDGKYRLDDLFIRLFGADDTEYVRTVTRKVFAAAVARIYEAGCKFDYMLVLIGDQGVGKSTTIKLMGGEWFTDSLPKLDGEKSTAEQLQGAWLVEVGELAAMKRQEVDAVKLFVSKTEDRYRVAYGKRVEHFPRQCVFFGTSNEADILRDVTGNRRFWIINFLGKRGEVHFMDYLTEYVIGQLWAEAKMRYEEGEALYLDNDMEAVAKKVQDDHLEKDERAGLISDYLNRLLPEDWDTMLRGERRVWIADEENKGTELRRQVCVLEIWAECLGQDINKIRRIDSMEIARIMKSFRDWEPLGNSRSFGPYGRQKGYKRRRNEN